MTSSIISRIEITEFSFEVRNLEVPEGSKTQHSGGTPGGAIEYAPGQTATMSRYAVVIETRDGCRGEYATHYVGTRSALGQSLMLARTSSAAMPRRAKVFMTT